ncbi:MAG: chitobiase/beta-hexosaminidase C-terminal domain-containing protein, partial [Verrucomicrobia bacterium]|nr:chitobiase/beta-hexosaminidase C-terminal domain-containing protein [Verrucomicrobiota bacterium]
MSAAAGTFRWRMLCVLLLTALRMGAADPVNLALNQPADASGPSWGAFSPALLTDGNPETFCHPLAAEDTEGFYYEVDLGGTFTLDHLRLHNRADGCCPERLSSYDVEVYGDREGEAGELNWSARIRADGSHSGVRGVDAITGSQDPDGRFAGRFIRIVNRNNAPYSPQVAEIEVFGGQGPKVLSFTADVDTLSAGASTLLHWEIEGATRATVEPDVGSVDPVRGSVAVRPAVTTTYRLVAGTDAGTTVAEVTLGVDVRLEPPRIREFLASNSGGLPDEDGDASDWIELENPNPYRLSLAGFGLTDDPENPRQWIFPEVQIPAGGRWVVFASGKDRRDPGGPLHTNFRLSADGEYLAVSDSSGLVSQQFPPDYPATRRFPVQSANVSYGLGTNGVTGFFRRPTPGELNGSAYDGIVAPIQLSVPRGFYDAPIRVTLGTDTPGAEIRYTTNRTEPSPTSGSVYTAPLDLAATTVLRVAAFRPGWAPADLETQTYVFPADILTSRVMRTAITQDPRYAAHMVPALRDLPSVSLTTPRPINGSSETRGSMEWLHPDGQPGVHAPCGIRHFGGAFTDFTKKNFRLYFRSEYGASKLRYPLFEGQERGRGAAQEFDSLELRSGSHDMEMRGFYLSNLFTDDTLLDMGRLNPHGRFVHLYLNGVYWGLYHLRERWNAAMHQEYLGGSRTNYEAINGNWNVGGWADPGTAYDGDGSTWARVKSLRDRYQDVRPWLDVAQYTDFMIMWMFGGSEDEYRCVGPTVPGTGFQFYLNDADGWFCVPSYCAAGNRTGRGAPGREAGDGPGSLFSTLFKEGDPEYRILLADEIHRTLFNDGALTPARNAARLTRHTDAIARAFLAESARWNYLTPTEWAARRDSVLNTWLPRRTAEVRGQFRSAGFYPAVDAPTHAPASGPVAPGTVVRFLGPAGATIHYTLDGTDPRLPGGAVSPVARSLTVGGAATTVVPAGARWRWFTSAAGLSSSDVVEGHPNWSAADWKHPEFADGVWREGAAQLGYGEGDEATVIPFGGNPQQKWITIYFRHRFVLEDAGGLRRAVLRLRRDDGAAVYVNGRPAVRDFLPDGPLTGMTPGISPPDDGQDFSSFEISPELLRPGANLLAVELHQSSGTSSDASFDLELSVETAGDVPDPDLPALTRNTLLQSRALQGGQWSALHTAFFQADPLPVAPGDVVVSELFCAPPGGGDDGEFVELANRSEHAVNLRGARFVEGIGYRFPESWDT